jgi:hypothetical protein
MTEIAAMLAAGFPVNAVPRSSPDADRSLKMMFSVVVVVERNPA